MVFWQIVPSMFWDWIFKNRVFSTFPWIYLLWSVVWPWFVYWRKEQREKELLNTLEVVIECLDNFLEASKQIYPRKSRKNPIFEKSSLKMRLRLLAKTPIFHSKLFSNASRKFYIHSITLFKIFKRSAWHCSVRQ